MDMKGKDRANSRKLAEDHLAFPDLSQGNGNIPEFGVLKLEIESVAPINGKQLIRKNTQGLRLLKNGLI